MPHEDDQDPTPGQPSEGPSGFSGTETATGGADAVPDTPDALPHVANQPTRTNQPDYPDQDQDPAQ